MIKIAGLGDKIFSTTRAKSASDSRPHTTTSVDRLMSTNQNNLISYRYLQGTQASEARILKFESK